MNPYEPPTTEPSKMRVRLGYAIAAFQILPVVIAAPFWHLIFSVASHSYELSDWKTLFAAMPVLFVVIPLTAIAVHILRMDFVGEIHREL